MRFFVTDYWIRVFRVQTWESPTLGLVLVVFRVCSKYGLASDIIQHRQIRKAFSALLVRTVRDIEILQSMVSRLDHLVHAEGSLRMTVIQMTRPSPPFIMQFNRSDGRSKVLPVIQEWRSLAR